MTAETTQLLARLPNVGKTERGASLGAGLALLVQILKRKPNLWISLPLGLGAGYLVYRGATGHCLLYERLEIRRSTEGNGGIKVQRSITINKPRGELFRLWRNFENLPRFMTHLRSVRVHQANGETHSHWIAKALLGKAIEWDAEVTGEEENKYIAWQSLPGSTVQSAGSVRFSDAPGGHGTVVTVDMQYHPPAGSIGAAFAKLFGQEPAQQIHEDLHHFKQMVETGEIASVAGQTSGRNNDFGETIEESQRAWDVVDEASMESFPASDAPGWIKGVT